MKGNSGSGIRLGLVNGLVPGAGLVVEGDLLTGVPLLLASVVVMAVAGLAAALLAGGLATQVLLGCLAAWLVLGVVATGGWWFRMRRLRIDPEEVRRLHREALSAWLRGEPGAIPAARRLTRAAPAHPGAWRVLERLAHDAGDTALARRAGRTARHLELV